MGDFLIAFFKDLHPNPGVARHALVTGAVRWSNLKPRPVHQATVHTNLVERLCATPDKEWYAVLSLIEPSMQSSHRGLYRFGTWYLREFLVWRQRNGMKTYHPQTAFMECPFRRGFRIAFAVDQKTGCHSLRDTCHLGCPTLDDIVFSRLYRRTQDPALFGEIPSKPILTYPAFNFAEKFLSVLSRGDAYRHQTSVSDPVDPPIRHVRIHITARLPFLLRLQIKRVLRDKNYRTRGTYCFFINGIGVDPKNVALSFHLDEEDPANMDSNIFVVSVTDDRPEAKPHAAAQPYTRGLSRLIRATNWFGSSQPPTTPQRARVIIDEGQSRVTKTGYEMRCPKNSTAILDCICECIFGLLHVNISVGLGGAYSRAFGRE